MKSKFFTGTFIVLMCAAMSLFCSCSENKLKMAVEAGNQKCPLSLGITGELTHIEYEDNTVELLFTIDEQFIDIDKIAADPESLKESVLAWSQNKDTKMLFEMIIEAGADLRYIYKGKTTGKEAELYLTPSELQQALEMPAPTSEDKLRLAIQQTNRQMLLDTGTGVIVIELVEQGDVVVYMSKVTDKDQFDYIARNQEGVKNNQRVTFKMMGPTDKAFFKMIAEAGKGLGYTYYMEGSDETIEVIHSNSELKEIFE